MWCARARGGRGGGSWGARSLRLCSQDGDTIHTNIDTDVLVAEEPPHGSTRKPDEMYSVIEHFCLGTRRIELFGEVRPSGARTGGP